MDIPSLSVGMADAQLRDQVGTSVMKMALDQEKGQGAALAKLMGSAELPAIVDPALGARVNLLV